MLATPSGIPACPETGRQHRLAAQLTDMIPGAVNIRVSLTDPSQADKTVALSRTTARVAARWILRVWPEADWTRPHILDLADATLIPSDLAAGRGR